MKLILFLVGVAVVAGWMLDLDSSIQDSKRTDEQKAEIAARKKAEDLAAAELRGVVILLKAFKETLNDPSSFDVKSALKMDDGTLCLEYRARNAFNALIFQRTVIRDSRLLPGVDDWNKYCAGKRGEEFERAKRYL